MTKIRNDQELAVQQELLALVEGVVESWKKKLLPHNPKNFAIYAEGALDEAEKLKAEIDEYLERRKSIAPNAATSQSTPGQQPTNVP